MWRAAMITATLAMSAALYAADNSTPSNGFQLTSPDIASGRTMALAQVFNSFGCSGQNISPALSWSHAPAGTQSFALLVHDPDAPTGSGWWHWLVYNIPASATSLSAGAGNDSGKLLPEGAVQGRTDFGNHSYGGPCPPPGALISHARRSFRYPHTAAAAAGTTAGGVAVAPDPSCGARAVFHIAHAAARSVGAACHRRCVGGALPLA